MAQGDGPMYRAELRAEVALLPRYDNLVGSPRVMVETGGGAGNRDFTRGLTSDLPAKPPGYGVTIRPLFCPDA